MDIAEIMGFANVLDVELVMLANTIGVQIYVVKPIVMDSVKWYFTAFITKFLQTTLYR